MAIVFGGTAIVIAAAAWGGTPAKQLPFIAASTLVGAFLPSTARRVGEQRPQTNHRISQPMPTAFGASRRTEETRFVCGIPAMPDDERPNRQITTATLISIAGALLIMVAFGSLSESGWGAVLCFVGVTACLFAAPTMFYETDLAAHDFTIEINDHGITLKQRSLQSWPRNVGSVSVGWEHITGLRLDPAGGYVYVAVSHLLKAQFERWYRIVGRGKAYPLRETKWHSDRDTLPLVKVKWLTSSAAGFYDALERHSGLPVIGR